MSGAVGAACCGVICLTQGQALDTETGDKQGLRLPGEARTKRPLLGLEARVAESDGPAGSMGVQPRPLGLSGQGRALGHVSVRSASPSRAKALWSSLAGTVGSAPSCPGA